MSKVICPKCGKPIIGEAGYDPIDESPFPKQWCVECIIKFHKFSDKHEKLPELKFEPYYEDADYNHVMRQFKKDVIKQAIDESLVEYDRHEYTR